MTVTVFFVLAAFATAENIRGPLAATLVVEPDSTEAVATLSIESIVMIELGGDERFFDALDLQLTVPSVVSRYPGAVVATILASAYMTERAGIADVTGVELLIHPLHTPGMTLLVLPVREEAELDASAAMTVIDTVVPADEFPIAFSLLELMKGIDEDLLNAEFRLAVRPVTRNIGGVLLTLRTETGEPYDMLSLRVPEFQLAVDGEEVSLRQEYLLEPGLRRFTLTSEQYQDQEITVGVERGTQVEVEMPLLPALATVSYSAPRGARVYVDGRALDLASGDFTVQPGAHTIVVAIGDYTVTKRFTVEEGREYSISLMMDIDVEEIK